MFQSSFKSFRSSLVPLQSSFMKKGKLGNQTDKCIRVDNPLWHHDIILQISHSKTNKLRIYPHNPHANPRKSSWILTKLAYSCKMKSTFFQPCVIFEDAWGFSINSHGVPQQCTGMKILKIVQILHILYIIDKLLLKLFNWGWADVLVWRGRMVGGRWVCGEVGR